MKKNFARVSLLALAFAATLLLSNAYTAKAAPAGSAPAVAAALPAAPVVAEPAAAPASFQDRDDRRREQHPHIRQAIRELNEAKRELQTAAHDFGGHREEAVRACDEAIRQLQQALQYDKK